MMTFQTVDSKIVGLPFALICRNEAVIYNGDDGIKKLPKTSTIDVKILNGNLIVLFGIEVPKETPNSQVLCPMATSICNHERTSLSNQNRRGVFGFFGFNMSSGNVLEGRGLESALMDWKFIT